MKSDIRRYEMSFGERREQMQQARNGVRRAISQAVLDILSYSDVSPGNFLRELNRSIEIAKGGGITGCSGLSEQTVTAYEQQFASLEKKPEFQEAMSGVVNMLRDAGMESDILDGLV